MNSRLRTIQLNRRMFLLVFFWLPVTFFSLLLIYNTIPYFSFSVQFDFIRERAVLFLMPAYRFCFYLHLAAGMFCVGTALLQFSPWVLRKRRWLHIWSGRVYVLVVLLIGAPTGLYMSFFAKGGWAERGLFVFMAVSWFYFTLKGLTTILRGNVLAHKCWMIRSYAMALTAVTFRIYYLAFYLADVPLHTNYAVSLWISVIGNLMAAEYIIYRSSKSYLSTFTR